MCAVSSASMPAPQHKGASQQGGLPPRVGLADVSRCHRLLEQCLVRELNQRQAMALLQRYAGISPVFSGCGAPLLLATCGLLWMTNESHICALSTPITRVHGLQAFAIPSEPQ